MSKCAVTFRISSCQSWLSLSTPTSIRWLLRWLLWHTGLWFHHWKPHWYGWGQYKWHGTENNDRPLDRRLITWADDRETWPRGKYPYSSNYGYSKHSQGQHPLRLPKIPAIAVPVCNATENGHSPFRASWGWTFPSSPSFVGFFIDFSDAPVFPFITENHIGMVEEVKYNPHPN